MSCFKLKEKDLPGLGTPPATPLILEVCGEYSLLSKLFTPTVHNNLSLILKPSLKFIKL